jgi:hypothetical protein
MTGDDGKPVSYLERRFVAEPESATILGEVVTEAQDRLDLVSVRMIGQPGQWWTIADAHHIIHPEELEKPAGQRLRIPLPGSQTGEGGS